jgi:PBP1b-binding outer membrane lipoprotein LpoB
MKSLINILIISLLLASCKETPKQSNKKWSENDRASFLESCAAQGKLQNIEASMISSYCNCMLEKFEAKYASQKEAANISINEIGELTRDCVK